MSKNVYTIAELKAKEGKFDDLKTTLQALAAETRKESGAIEYFFIEDQKNPNTILSYEKWENAEEEGKHWDTPHLKAAIDKFGDILDGAPVVHKGLQII